MVEVRIDLNENNDKIVRTYMAINNISSKDKAINEMIKEIGKKKIRFNLRG